MPEICRFYGIVITMYSVEHNPPHFHVRYNDKRATINIIDETIEGDIPNRVKNMVIEWLKLHKTELMENWSLLANGKQIIEIEPLD